MSSFVPSQRLIVDDTITTGQAVTLEITPASPLLRVAATLIDIFVSVMSMALLMYVFSRVLDTPSDSMIRVYMILTLCTLTIFIPLAVEFFTRGRSLGKWAFNLQVVRDDGGVITLRHSMVRILVSLVEVWMTLGSFALLTTILNRRSKRLGDIAAGTMLIHYPEAVSYPALLMPPDAAIWATQANISRLPADLVQRATMFIRSTSSLLPEVRVGHGSEIAAELRRFVEPAPPATLHPERFIAAVLVVNRDRDIRKLERWEAARHSTHASTK